MPTLAERQPPRRRALRTLAAALITLMIGTSASGQEPTGQARAGTGPTDWKLADIPGAWRSAPKGPSDRPVEYAWYRSRIDVPAAWAGRDVELFVEGVDDAREVFWNGRKVGQLGQFPPRYRSGLNQSRRLSIPETSLQFGAGNVLAIRVYHRAGRSGFNVAAPVVFAGDEAVRLEGSWQFRPGDAAAGMRDEPLPDEIAFRDTMSAEVAQLTLRKLPGELGPLPVAESLKHFEVVEGLRVEACLADPDIGQPLSIKFDERGRLWLLEYLQYPNPAGLKVVSRDKFLRTIYDKVPAAPPRHDRGRDRITIHEDSNGDGRFDRHSTFVDGLNIATAFARGRGGVWVLNPPYLLFYPDRNQDDVPDGDPQVHLEGFGLEDSHSVTNSLRWGPDGWLYATQGSTVTGQVRRPGSTDPPRHSMGQLVWRYQPGSGRYEIFAEGGGNAFGVEFDAQGRVYSGHNGGNTRGFHYVQGGYYQKGFGKHGVLSNPYTYGYFPPMKHHDVPRFTHTFVVYEGGLLPAPFAGRIFGVGPLQSHVIMADRQTLGATFATTDVGTAWVSKDTWVRPVDIQVGPDGAIYVADFYEQRIDHASHYQGRVDKSTGRIYRVALAENSPRYPRLNLSRVPASELLEYLKHPNKWYRQTVQRMLADRFERQEDLSSVVATLRAWMVEGSGQTALEALWALHACGAWDVEVALEATRHAHPMVRAWAVRLLGDRASTDTRWLQRLLELARDDSSIEVRSQLACSARRLPAVAGLPIARGLLQHSEDLDDPFQPLLVWWLVEAAATQSPELVVRWMEDSDIWHLPLMRHSIAERLMRRWAQSGTRAELLLAAALFRQAPGAEDKKRLMAGFEAGVQGRSLAGLPETLVTAIADAGGLSLELRLRRQEPAAWKEALQLLADKRGDLKRRLRLLEILAEIHPPRALDTLRQLWQTAQAENLQTAALAALQAYDDREIAQDILLRMGRLPPNVQEAGFAVLASRPVWTRQVLQAITAEQLDASIVPDAFKRRALLQRDADTAQRIEVIWGKIAGATTAEMFAEVERLTGVVTSADGNPYQGKQLFEQNCGKCHRLFDEGGRIGPDLTEYQRSDLKRVLLNVVNPNAEIREGYESFVVATADGRTLTGFIDDQDDQVVVLKNAEGQRSVLLRNEIDELLALPNSVMPERLLTNLSSTQIRDLFSYLRSTQPLP